MAAPQMSNQQQFSIPPISELLLGVLVLCLVLILLVPLPEFVIDMSITLNVALGVVLLMMSLYVQKPLDLAAFPSIILVGTMFRLALGVAATRQILATGHAGHVIQAFGVFVTQGNLVVGVVIFVIITIVQFMVITKGAERIAEVSARFALDAMPGKQMTIDADFNAGLISPDEAVKRRNDLQRESSLMGSMDGAMKFVKGDTIAGIIITVINIIGGLAIGMTQRGLPLQDAVNTYTILTIGDGLSAQVPSLLMSISCGITMSRSTASSDSLAKDLFEQVQSKPYGLLFAAGFLLLITVTTFWTGLPWWSFAIITVIVFFISISVFLAQDVQQQLGQLDAVKQNMNELINPNRMYEKLGVDVLSVQVGTGLLKIADPDQDGQLLGKIAGLRSRLTDELGFILPNIRIMDSLSLEPNEYLISIRNNPVATGRVYPDHFMVLKNLFESAGVALPPNAITDVDPTFGMDAIWVPGNDIPPQFQNQAVEATDVVISHLKEISVKNVDDIMTKMDILKLMQLVQQQDQSLVQELVPNMLTPNDMRKIIVNLVREKVSVKDVMFVFERLSDYARFSKEPDVLSERLRAAMGRQICIQNADNEKHMLAVTLSQDWEKILDDSCQRTELGTMFMLNPLQVQELIDTTGEVLKNAQRKQGHMPVILCSPRIRLPLYQLLDRHIPMVAVMSYSELIPDVRVTAVGTVGGGNLGNTPAYG
jgi:flagellar biosynthesis protein FlhA